MALPQPIHIFRKDLIHLWPETLFVILLFVAFAWSAPSGWTGNPYAGYVTILSALLKFLMPVSWLVLIARGIQDESLVGDRQFWTSRPYHWFSLLLAKVLLIVTCIYVPFLLMQVYLLKRAGLYPTLAMGSLLHNLLLLTVLVVIPMAALAAVTSTFPRVLLAVIGAFFYLLILFVAMGWTVAGQMQPPQLEWLLNAIFVVLPLAVLLYQYRTRKTLYARLSLAAIPLLAVVLLLLTPTRALIAQHYPLLTGNGTPQLSSLTGRYKPDANGEPMRLRKYVMVALPVAVTGMDQESNFTEEGARVTLDVPGGMHYVSPFLTAGGVPGMPGPQFNAGSPVGEVSFLLPESVYDQVKGKPADLHLEIVGSRLHADKPSTWHATLLPFSVPGGGVCRFEQSMAARTQMPVCRFAFKQPEVSVVSAKVAPASCENKAMAVPGRASLGSPAAPFDLDPVVTVPMSFQTGDPNPQHNYVLCPGTELTFLEATKAGGGSVALDQKALVLDPFVQRIAPAPVPGAADEQGPGPQQGPAPTPR